MAGKFLIFATTTALCLASGVIGFNFPLATPALRAAAQDPAEPVEDSKPKKKKERKKKQKEEKAKSNSNSEVKPDAADDKASNLPKVLDSSQFFGEAAMGYAACKNCPEIASKLFCYCGCDITDKHTNLLDCFTNFHGVDCHICQEEVVMALRMKREGNTLEEIQKKVDQTYSHHYPFETDTPAYTAYKAKRLWKHTSDRAPNQASETTSDPSGQTNAAAETKSQPAAPPKLKPGAKMSKCCSMHKEQSNDKDSKN